MIIYLADIEELNNDNYNKALQIVSGYRLQKADSLKMEADKRRSLTAGLLLNYATGVFLKEETECNADICRKNNSGDETGIILEKIPLDTIIERYNSNYDFTIKTNSYGKPYYDGKDNIHFSISHSGRYVACVVSTNPVGVDIEGWRDVSLKVSERYFSGNENVWISENGESERINRFFCIWTLKEAYSKATGEGLAREIRRTEFDVENKICRINGQNREEVRFETLETDGYSVSVVVLSPV
ncbi:MAG: 4'-phosphopantetheinyl transferase family protein [Lachnospira sp.]